MSPVYYNVSLSGPKGDRLHLLNRIVSFVDSPSCTFRGLKLHYDDGEIRSYGVGAGADDIMVHQQCVQHSFTIDGKRGEWISAIRVLNASRPYGADVLSALEVGTPESYSRLWGRE